MDYKTLRKNYRLYIRSAGLLAMFLIVCIGLVVRDTLLQTGGLLLVLAGLFLFIQWLKKSYTKKCNTLLHVDLDLAFWQQYLQLNKNVKKKHFTDRYEVDIGRLFFYDGRFRYCHQGS